MDGPDSPVAAAEDALAHLDIEGPPASADVAASDAVAATASHHTEGLEMALNLLLPTAAPVIKKVHWGVSTPAIEDRVALKGGEPATNGDLPAVEGVNVRSSDGNVSPSAEAGGGEVAEVGDVDESSSAEEGNDEEPIPDDDDSSVSDDGENANIEVHYTEEDIQNLVDEFFQAEQNAIRAQEMLEDESLKATRLEVSLELSETKSGPELEAAVEEEMTIYTEEWEELLAELEDQIAILQEKLEEAGLDLPHLYKLFEKQLPDLCITEAWKKRTHWAGIMPTSEVYEVVQKAEMDLKERRPVRRHHGRIQDEGASGFLVTKVKAQTQSDDVPEDGWSLYDILDKEEDNLGPGSLMGTEKWANVYLASTPEQAAQMGLSLPGYDTVEEIGDLDADKSRLFKQALASEGEQSLAGKQKIIVKKVCEEDDVKKTKKLQRKLLPPRPRKPRTNAQRKFEGAAHINESGASSSGADLGLKTLLPVEENVSLPDQVKNLKIEGDVDLPEAVLLDASLNGTNSHDQGEDGKDKIEKVKSEPWIIDMAGVVHLTESQRPGFQNGVASLRPSRQAKRRLTPTEIDGYTHDRKRRKTVVMIDSDGEHEVQEFSKEKKLKDDVVDLVRESAEVVVLGSRKDSSQKVQLEDLTGNWLIPEDGDDNPLIRDELLRPNTRKRRSSSNFFQDIEPRNFSCTACGMLLKNREVMKHPSLDVGICRKCKTFLFSGPFNKDADGHEDECRWCGQGGDVLCCETCDKVFCCQCIKRNFGDEECGRIAESTDWKCFFCNKQPLHNLRQQYQAVKEALKAQQADGDDDFVGAIGIKKRNRRKNIRKVLDDAELDEKTKHLLALEKERQERLETWRANAIANGRGPPVKPNRYNRHVHKNDELLDMDEDDIAEEGFILNKIRADNEESVRISPHISHFLRPHQLAGMRFMWENCIESVSKVKSGVDGLGCILAHSMGLGKTLQVIGFVHTVLKKMDLGLKTVLVVVPVNVLHNWRSEFHKWQPGNEVPIPVYMLEDVARDNVKRSKLLAKWKSRGGVMLIGYAAFRNCAIGKTVKEKAVRESFCATLQDPGPDILVCDEAHMIKNDKADITQALRQVRTHRRIALTGSPLQNNLQEYYCMVDFVREGFLGPLPDFRRRFSNPIENGQRLDSTSRDVKLMKHRAHVLHKQLEGFVQRKTMTVLKDELPSKCVYVISVRLSPLQRALYLKFLQMHGFLDNGKNVKPQSGRNILFQAYHTLAKIWNHPDLLILAQEAKDLRKEDNVENFIVDKDDDVPDVGTDHGATDGVIVISDDNGVDGTVKETGLVESKINPSNDIRTPCRADGNHEDVDKSGWWKDLMEGQPRNAVEMSGKMLILMKILTLSSAKSDKALVFSQSLHTLDLIEVFLENLPCLNGYKGNWKKNRDWYRLDGQTSAKSRQDLVESFNDPENTSVQCVLISTRAGSLGINLPAANRVIIFDGSWNPTHDLQALFRAWRFGQKKNVYAYRLLASGTMEEKIYNRQVAKEGLAARVLDEHQVARHFLEQDLDFFFVLDDDDCPEDEDNSHSADVPPAPIEEEAAPAQPLVKPKRAAFSVPNDAPPRDDVMGKLLLEYRPKCIGRYHEHEPLLEDLEDEKLSKEEQALAWESFQHEESVPQNLATSIPGMPHMFPIPMFQQNPVSVPFSFPSVQFNPIPLPHSAAPPHVPKPACSLETHIRQLKVENIQSGSASLCDLCDQQITWETITLRP
ncbi:hypothetical protein M758_2G134500 [Ceratodon purpureus]|nr:hypothetical protein M758_2G134500 [Ceratodon purpureus]